MARKKAATRSRSPLERSITSNLKVAIAARDLTDYQLGRLADVDPCLIGRFMRGERDIRGATIDRLADALGLQLVDKSRSRGRPASANEPAKPAKPSRRSPAESQSGAIFEAEWLEPVEVSENPDPSDRPIE